MSTLQTLLALVVLIFVLAVIVQAVQEFLKSLLNTKAETMKATIVKFMGARLTYRGWRPLLQTGGWTSRPWKTSTRTTSGTCWMESQAWSRN